MLGGVLTPLRRVFAASPCCLCTAFSSLSHAVATPISQRGVFTPRPDVGLPRSMPFEPLLERSNGPHNARQSSRSQVEATLTAKNELESAVYSALSAVVDGLAPFLNESERAELVLAP